MNTKNHILGIVILTFIWGTYSLTDRTPYSDEYVYLEHAYSLYSDGIFGEKDFKTEYSEHGARVAPLYPVFLSSLMFLNNDFVESAICHLTSVRNIENNCPNNFFIVKVVQLLIFSFFLSYIWLLLVKIFESILFSYLTIWLLLLSGTPFYYANHFLTESLYLAFAFIFLLALAIAIIEQNDKYTVISAFFLSITALTRPTYLYLFYILLLIFPLLYFFTNKYFINVKKFTKFYLIFFMTFTLVSGLWVTRNVIHFDKFAITVGYSDKPVATRVAHNSMTDEEYIAGWIYWLPDFGDSLAEKIFGIKNTHRLSFSSPQSFYPAGRHIVDKKINNAMNLDDGVNRYNSRMEALLKLYIYPDIIKHAKITLLLAWRGFFVDKYFGLIGFFFLIWAIAGGIKDKYARYFHIIVIPPLILLFFQASISISIPRYNLVLLLPLSIAIASGLIALFKKINDLKLKNKWKIKNY